jgi:Na+/H+-dicarboxylate symporter
MFATAANVTADIAVTTILTERETEGAHGTLAAS